MKMMFLFTASTAFAIFSASAFAGTTACVYARTQIGDNGGVGRAQNCQYNISGTMQAGDRTTANTRQNGFYNSANSVQLGNGGAINVRQRGPNNSAGAYQYGDRTRAHVDQW